jgi:hypothetical protein
MFRALVPRRAWVWLWPDMPCSSSCPRMFPKLMIDPLEELTREANLVFGHFNLEYELGLFTKQKEQESSA